MRIKTSKNVLEQLPEIKNNLGFDNNAQVLKLAINFVLVQEKKVNLESVEEDGFEIDVNILFGEQKDYYFLLLKEKFCIEKVDKSFITGVIEYGFAKMQYYLKLSKGNLEKFTRYIMEEVCI